MTKEGRGYLAKSTRLFAKAIVALAGLLIMVGGVNHVTGQKPTEKNATYSLIKVYENKHRKHEIYQLGWANSNKKAYADEYYESVRINQHSSTYEKVSTKFSNTPLVPEDVKTFDQVQTYQPNYGSMKSEFILKYVGFVLVGLIPMLWVITSERKYRNAK